MRRDAQAIEDERVEAAQALKRRGRNLAQVGRVGEVVEAISDDGQTAVYDFERRDQETGTEREGRARDDGVRDDLRETAAVVGRLEDVLEDAADVHPRALVGIDAERAVVKVQGAYVVETEDVIGVAVRDEHCVEPLEALAE